MMTSSMVFKMGIEFGASAKYALQLKVLKIVYFVIICARSSGILFLKDRRLVPQLAQMAKAIQNPNISTYLGYNS